MSKLKCGVLLCIALAHIFCSYSQEKNVRFSALSVEDGLSQSSVFTIAQDQYGYIWLGTFDGLNRYDGYTIKTFYSNPNEEFALPDSYIQALKTDLQGNLWVGTNHKGLCRFQYYDESFISIPQYNDSVQDGLVGTSVLAIDILSDTTLLVLTEEGLNVLNTNTLSCQFLGNTTIYNDRAGLVSFFNQQGDSISCILNDAKGESWYGTAHGLIRQIPGVNSMIYHALPYDLTSLSADEITCVFEDRGGVLWVGTSLGGVNKWERSNEEVALFKAGKSLGAGLNNGKVRCFYEAFNQDSIVWVGTVEGGLNAWNRSTGKFSYWDTKNSDLRHNHIRDIEYWKDGYLIGMDGGGLQYFKPQSNAILPFHIEGVDSTARVWDIHVTGDSIWIATFDRGLFLFHEAETRSIYTGATESVTCIAHDGAEILVGTFGDGFFEISDQNIEHITKDNSGLSDDRIYAIVPHHSGDFWIGTKGGLNHYIPAEQVFKTYTVADGLPNNTVMGIIPQGNANVWLSTNYGISNLNIETASFVNYDIENGLQNNEFLVHSYYTLHSGEMLFGGIDGFNVFPPTGLTDNMYLPEIVISHIDLEVGQWKSDSVLAVKEVLELDYHQNKFTLTFEALSYANSEKNQYRFMMEGFDENWSIPGTRRFARYTNLPPGDYTFKVMASNCDGVWNPVPTLLKIKILPEFWQTWWFRILTVFLVLIILFLMYNYRVKRIRVQNIKLEKEVIIRTRQVVHQKTEIESKNKIIEGALHDIEDSLTYAKKIQSAMLPYENELKRSFENAFVYFKPREIVSGDFYWFKPVEDRIFFAVVDCTGHGVPGAFISIIGNGLLNQILANKPQVCTSQILNELNERTILALNQKDDDTTLRDGMDVALCCLKQQGDQKIIEFAGARNPMYIVRLKDMPPPDKFDLKLNSDTHTLYLIKGDSASIGVDFGVESIFECEEYEVFKGDKIYISSDGYPDQFGGPKGKKFLYSNFRAMLLEIQQYPMAEQKRKMDIILKEWKGPLEQIDDICVMGIEI